MGCFRSHSHQVCEHTGFYNPPISDIRAALTNGAARPRLIAGNSRFETLKTTAETDETLQGYISDLEDSIDNFLWQRDETTGDYVLSGIEKVQTALPDNSISDGTRLDNASDIQNQIMKCALAYKLTGKEVYRDRAIAVMMNTASDTAFPDWNPKAHFLDTAGIMYGMGFGYDWLCDELTDDQKTAISSAIMTKGLEAALLQHTSPYCNFNWTANKTNWNFVCNSASIVAALAVGDIDTYSETCAEIIQKSLASMKGSIKKFSADGSWYEGTNYGQYAMGYYMPAVEAMNTALGTDYGYGSVDRINAFNDFIIYTGGARETFNFGDGGEALVQSPTLSLYSLKTGNNFYGAYRYNQIQRITGAAAGVWDIVWYDAAFASCDISAASGDKLFSGIDTAAFRSSLFDSVSFAGLHGGDNSVTHSHLDSGSFVYDVNGVRFAGDLGQDNYNLPGYFTTDETKADNRWNYYRTRAEGHNTIVINPDGGVDQKVNSVSKITDYKSRDGYGYAVLDTTDAYSDDVLSSKRGIYYNRNNYSLLVQDEISLKAASDVYWFMHFAEGAQGASVTIADDGKSAILVREAKRVWVGILSAGGTFTLQNAAPLDGISPNPDGQASNSWYKKLQIMLDDVDGSRIIAVYMVPLAEGENAPSELPSITEMSNWQ